MANANATQERIRRATILLVDDDPGDCELTRRVLADEVVRSDLRVVGDGAQAFDYLRQLGAFDDPSSAPRPDLILLDLNMPVMDGRELLQRIRLEPSLCDIPIVILTTSNQESDILRSYELGCNSFITKPVSLDGFAKAIRDLGRYWFELVTLPPH